MSYTDELFDNNFSFISSFISLQSIFQKKKKETFTRLLFWVALTIGGGGGGGGGGRLLEEVYGNTPIPVLVQIVEEE